MDESVKTTADLFSAAFDEITSENQESTTDLDDAGQLDTVQEDDVFNTPASEPLEPESPAQPNVDEIVKQERATWQGRISKEQEARRALEQELEELRARQDRTQSPADDIPFDSGAVAEFKSDFPDIAKAVVSMIQQAKEEILAMLDDRTAKVIDQRVAPVVEHTKQQLMQQHFTTIESVHKDWRKYLDDGSLFEWIDSKAPRRRDYYKDIYNTGSAEDVIEMLTEFKDQVGIAGTQTAPQPRATPAALQAVRSRPTPAPRASRENPEDFDGTFDKLTRV